jgi:hypothetical protein
MANRAFTGCLIAGFAIAVGHLTWQSILGPPRSPKYFVGGHVIALRAPKGQEKQLYLRRQVFLSQRPRHAWLQAAARDDLRLYVNGKLAGKAYHPGFAVAVLVDLVPYLQAGPNVLALVTRQEMAGERPAVAVAGAYTLGDGSHPIEPDELWRCSTAFERTGNWWFVPEFDDRMWAVPEQVTCWLRAQVQTPPSAVTSPSAGQWITPEDRGQASLRREFAIVGRPRQGWLRLTTTSAYRLAINGIPLDLQEDSRDTTTPVLPVQRTYEITHVLRRGPNVLSLVLTDPNARFSQLLADLEVEDESGNVCRLGSDGDWLSCPGQAKDWLELQLKEPATWRPCLVQAGDLGVPPWKPHRITVQTVLPWPLTLHEIAREIGLILVIGLVTALCCCGAKRLLAAGRGGERGRRAAQVVYVALVPATVAIAAGVLAIYDPRVDPHDVYQVRWLLLALGSVPLQWLILAAVAQLGKRPWVARNLWGTSTRRRLAIMAIVLGLLAVGLWLRLRNIDFEPLDPDEVSIMRLSYGLVERGFASIQIHEDLPILYTAGCELECSAPALMTFLTQKDYLIVRLPTAIFGVLTIPMLYICGRRLFCSSVGLLAAAFQTFAPFCVQTGNYGRYPSLLQLVTVMTVYLFYRTVDRRGPISRRGLWLTAGSFSAMFFSWEASAFIAAGMIAGVLLHRRKRLRTLFSESHLYPAMIVVLTIFLLQHAHSTVQSTQYLMYGTGWSDVKLTPMWRYQYFTLTRYLWQASWAGDGLIPMTGLVLAGLLCIRHAFRRPCRMLILIFLAPCLLMTSLLPLWARRYSYHLVPLLMLLVAAVLVAGARGLARLVPPGRTPLGWRHYAEIVGGLSVLTIAALASGVTVHLAEMTAFKVAPDLIGAYRVPNLEGPSKYLRDHFQEGDVVIAIHPDEVDHQLSYLGGPFPEGWRVDYWLETTLQLPAVLDDRHSIPRHRYWGTPMISTLADLKEVFARHRRVWYITIPSFHDKTNDADVSAYLREHMDVVYEDYQAMLLLRDNNHRPASVRLQDERILQESGANYLP